VTSRARVAAGEHHRADRRTPRRGCCLPDSVGRPRRPGATSRPTTRRPACGAVDLDGDGGGGGGGRPAWWLASSGRKVAASSRSCCSGADRRQKFRVVSSRRCTLPTVRTCEPTTGRVFLSGTETTSSPARSMPRPPAPHYPLCGNRSGQRGSVAWNAGSLPPLANASAPHDATGFWAPTGDAVAKGQLNLRIAGTGRLPSLRLRSAPVSLSEVTRVRAYCWHSRDTGTGGSESTLGPTG
jgi:hypothetical protein